MKFVPQGIDHVEVFVRDLEAAAEWYGRVLGLTEVRRWDPEPVMIGAGGTMLALFAASGGPAGAGVGPGRRPGAWRRVAWRTDEAGFARAQECLGAEGVAFRGPVDHGTSEAIYFSIYFDDPDGNPLEITWYV
jgi:catechol 2,3-dioxygenase-like lactoylglutathione lyase family enzyme